MIRGYRYIVLVLAAVITMGCQQTPEVTLATQACAVCPSGRASACACALDGKGYVFSGRDAKGTYLNDLWEYDPKTDGWLKVGNAPMNGRVNATMAADGGTLYMGLGYSALRAYNDTAYQRDWWSFSPSTGKWKRLADFPNGNTVAATSFVAGGQIYVLYGFGYGFTRDIYVYDIATDSWHAQEDVGRARMCAGACGTMKDGLLYFGTGYNTDNMSDWWVADLSKNAWTERQSVPGKGRQFSACAAGKEHIYLFGGRHFAGELTGGEVFESYLRYAPEKDAWEWCGAMPCGRAENMIALTIDGKVYFGLGEDANGKVLNNWYRIEE